MTFTNVKMLRLFTALGLCSARAPAWDTPAPCHVPLLPLPQLKNQPQIYSPSTYPAPSPPGPRAGLCRRTEHVVLHQLLTSLSSSLAWKFLQSKNGITCILLACPSLAPRRASVTVCIILSSGLLSMMFFVFGVLVSLFSLFPQVHPPHLSVRFQGGPRGDRTPHLTPSTVP